ncbi:M56 family metallopeptidase [Paenibacillus sp. FSL R7-0337]|uniref:M56 family metallopeptidase n=1 Tax=Paenibacillus sp. FSL R7-0337 TaxID=1926588 RepID=UPI00096E2465|nr:M56 family metallopeptidase [Paenibacillus sp. FSL R7-0337]OMF99466.1 peptidase M56 BlaR1 [Paenibacillus sp. FSL R7-0337]
MTDLWISILNMSITASYVAVAVMLARVLLRRAPKIFSYMLWSAVMIRLILPVSFTSSFSILKLVGPAGSSGTGQLQFVPKNIGMQAQPAVDTGTASHGSLLNSLLPPAAPAASVNPVQIILWAGSMIWLTGAITLLLYSVFSYIRIMRRVCTATLVNGHVFETDQIMTPFVFGFLKPRIYIPAGMSEQELSHILLHEQTHIDRRDYLVKPLMFLLVILHWFNPLMWLSFVLMSKDMEMSCDEVVIRKLGPQVKSRYSGSLLGFSARRSGLMTGSPLAFGESSVKARIKHILAYRKPTSRSMAACTLLIVILLIGCTANPKTVEPPAQVLDTGYAVDQLLESKTKYIGDASKVTALLGAMPLPEGLERAGIELTTGSRPYALTVNYKVNDITGMWNDELQAVSRDPLLKNSVLLFTLIDNADIIHYSLADEGISYSFTFTREEVDQLLGEDVRPSGADEAGLRKLIDRLDSVKLTP